MKIPRRLVEIFVDAVAHLVGELSMIILTAAAAISVGLLWPTPAGNAELKRPVLECPASTPLFHQIVFK